MPHLPALWALGLTALTVAVHLLLGRDASILTAAIILAMIGAVYAGFAIADGRPKTVALECIVAFAFGGAAMAGILVSPWFIVAATAAHAGWDFLHHSSTFNPAVPERPTPPTILTRLPNWYIPYCVIYDLCAAAALAALWFARGVLAH